MSLYRPIVVFFFFFFFFFPATRRLDRVGIGLQGIVLQPSSQARLGCFQVGFFKR
ncbi:unnamed protein product [Penicillium roqueforti FM164]|uniref:Genomic scaffold, ProqFM164S03 n=1 Tax=Penicillium roqueforti (strain FM164) TaxID=1365484 RepID=W6QIG2_PENRF|nr:unnamed protein product [Penicillium roqueforti FM164]